MITTMTAMPPPIIIHQYFLWGGSIKKQTQIFKALQVGIVPDCTDNVADLRSDSIT